VSAPVLVPVLVLVLLPGMALAHGAPGPGGEGGPWLALLLFAPVPLFSPPAPNLAVGLAPLEDQQLAGVVMATVACLAYPAVALRVLARWIRSQEAEHALARY
jgi:hypothetical protein